MPSVTIIGAGIAGIKAAVDLTRAGIQVTVLESLDRIGGRIKTLRRDGIRCELGAGWLHDVDSNEVFKALSKKGFEFAYDDGDYREYAYDTTGLASTDASAKAAKQLELSVIKRHEDRRAGKLVQSQDQSLRDFVLEVINAASDEDRPALMQAAASMRPIELWHGISWEKISSFDSYPSDESRDAIVKNGYDTVVEDLLAEADAGLLQIRTNTEVIEVSPTSKGTLVRTKAGGSYESDFAIVTVPIGVLKERHKTLFKAGSIPEPLRKGMDTATLAMLGKVAFYCDEPFWDPSLERVSVLPKAAHVCEDPNAHAPPVPCTMPLFFQNGLKVYGMPVLLGLMGQPLTEHLEEHPEETMTYFGPALELLRTNKSKPLPKIAYVVSDWTANPSFRCSYSACAVGETVDDNVAPFIAGSGRIRFAGEHTVVDGNGCVHGAYASGVREASYIMKAVGLVPSS